MVISSGDPKVYFIFFVMASYSSLYDCVRRIIVSMKAYLDG